MRSRSWTYSTACVFHYGGRLNALVTFGQLMNTVEDRSRLHTRLFHTLRKLCGQMGRLPTQYNLSKRALGSGDALKIIGEHPVASGGFADVWLGQHGDKVVAIKAFRVYGRANLDAVEKVGDRRAEYHLVRRSDFWTSKRTVIL